MLALMEYWDKNYRCDAHNKVCTCQVRNQNCDWWLSGLYIVTSIVALGQNVFETEIWRKRWRKEREEKNKMRKGGEKRKMYNYCRKSQWNEELKITPIF